MSSTFELEKYEIDVQGLMRGLVHELRNPLSAILTASTLLDSSPALDEETVMLLGVVQKESKRMNAILSEFSYFVKPPKPNVSRFDLSTLLRSQLAGAQWPSHVEVADELPELLPVYGDEHQIGQALGLILCNALEELPAGGSLAVCGRADDVQTTVWIEDSGHGLSGDALSRAFQPFFSTKPAATGLGLSMARMAARASGGDISIENRENNGGARVTLVLPTASDVVSESVVSHL